MNGDGKSDGPIVPTKPPNNATCVAAEVVEERGPAKGNTDDPTRPGRRAGQGVSSGLDRVREVARKDKEARFTALLHHVDLPRLWAAYAAINPKAAPGVDRVTWEAYGEDLRGNLEDLLARVHSGAYRASPSRRAYIPKADGRLRPLGIATLEDKILQRAVVEVWSWHASTDNLVVLIMPPDGRRCGGCVLRTQRGSCSRASCAVDGCCTSLRCSRRPRRAGLHALATRGCRSPRA